MLSGRAALMKSIVPASETVDLTRLNRASRFSTPLMIIAAE